MGGRAAYWRARLQVPYGALSLDLRDLELARGAAGHLHADRLAALVADQGTANRGLVRELVLGGVRLGGADDLELRRLVRLLVLDVHAHADAHHVRVDGLRVDHA